LGYVSSSSIYILICFGDIISKSVVRSDTICQGLVCGRPAIKSQDIFSIGPSAMDLRAEKMYVLESERHTIRKVSVLKV
jgi:hypothetical protein